MAASGQSGDEVPVDTGFRAVDAELEFGPLPPAGMAEIARLIRP
jgi:hypothetical protein